MNGCTVGLPWLWPVACPSLQMASRAFPALPNCANAGKRQGAPPFETLFVLTVWRAVRCHLIGARDLIIDSAPILAWRRTDPDAATGHAPAHHPRPLLHGYRVHTLLCRGSGLPVYFLLSPANCHDAPFARPLLELAVRLSHIHPRIIRLDAAYWGLQLIHWIHATLGAVAVIRLPPKATKEPLVLATQLDQRGIRQTRSYLCSKRSD